MNGNLTRVSTTAVIAQDAGQIHLECIRLHERVGCIAVITKFAYRTKYGVSEITDGEHV